MLADSEFDLVIHNVESVEKRDQYLRVLPLAKRTDGLLIVSLPPSDDEVAALASAAVPVVVIDAHARALAALPRVVGDDVGGGELATRHLLDLGHRRIGFVGDQFDNPFAFTSARDRYAGYEQALVAVGVPMRTELVALGAHSRYEARDLAARLLGLAEPPSAIFAASDTQNLGFSGRRRSRDVHGEIELGQSSGP